MLLHKSPLHETVSTAATDSWNDFCSIEELTCAVEHRAVGATTKPTNGMNVLLNEMPFGKDRIFHFIQEYPAWNENLVLICEFMLPYPDIKSGGRSSHKQQAGRPMTMIIRTMKASPV